MQLQASFAEYVLPPTIKGFFPGEGGLTISHNSLKMVARDGVEPPTPSLFRTVIAST
jgi:hypothetical protein